MNHLVSRRFGHSSKFSDLISYDIDKQTDYAFGLLVPCILVLAFAILWLIALVVLKFNSGYVGCASGKAFVAKKSEEDATLGETASASSGKAMANRLPRSVAKHERIARTIRASCFACGLCLLFASYLLLASGFGSIKKGTVRLDKGMSDTKQLLGDGMKITHSLFEASDRLLAAMEADSGDEYPKNCSSEKIHSIVGFDVDAAKDIVYAEVPKVDLVISENISDLDGNMEMGEQAATTAQATVKDASSLSWAPSIFVFALNLTVVSLMIGIVLVLIGRSTKIKERTMSFGFLPILVILVILSWVATCGFAVLAALNADACLGGNRPGRPEVTIVNIAEEFGHHEGGDNYLYELLKFYTKGCIGTDPMTGLGNFSDTLEAWIDSISLANRTNATAARALLDSSQSISPEDLWSPPVNATSSLSNECQLIAEAELQTFRALEADIQNILKNTRQVIELFRCDRIIPLYRRVVHKGVCTYAASGFAWSAILMLVISVFGTWLITLRTSWLATKADKNGGTSSSLDNEDSSSVTDLDSIPPPYIPICFDDDTSETDRAIDTGNNSSIVKARHYVCDTSKNDGNTNTNFDGEGEDGGFEVVVPMVVGRGSHTIETSLGNDPTTQPHSEKFVVESHQSATVMKLVSSTLCVEKCLPDDQGAFKSLSALLPSCQAGPSLVDSSDVEGPIPSAPYAGDKNPPDNDVCGVSSVEHPVGMPRTSNIEPEGADDGHLSVQSVSGPKILDNVSAKDDGSDEGGLDAESREPTHTYGELEWRPDQQTERQIGREVGVGSSIGFTGNGNSGSDSDAVSGDGVSNGRTRRGKQAMALVDVNARKGQSPGGSPVQPLLSSNPDERPVLVKSSE